MADDFNTHLDDEKDRRRGLSALKVAGLVAGGLLLLALGVGLGVWADLATRDDPPPQPVTAAPERPSAPAAAKVEPPVFTPPAFLDVKPEPYVPPASVPEPPAEDAGQAEAIEPPNPPRTAFAVPSPAAGDRPVIAIVIDDMGLDRARSQKIIDLPGPLTVSFLTYAEGLSAWAARAHAAGHEVMAHLPMEPLDAGENPGPGALRVAMSADDVRRQLATNLESWNGYVGVNNHMGSRFTMDADRMAVVMEVLKSRGLLWLDSKTTQNSAGISAAVAAGVPHVERDVFLDNTQTVAAVTAQLEDAERIARARGSAIAIGHPHDATIAALRMWLTDLPHKDVVLVPITALLAR